MEVKTFESFSAASQLSFTSKLLPYLKIHDINPSGPIYFKRSKSGKKVPPLKKSYEFHRAHA